MSVKEDIRSIVNSGKFFVPVSEEEEYAMWEMAKDMVSEAEYELLSNGHSEQVAAAGTIFSRYVDKASHFQMTDMDWCDLSKGLFLWQHGFIQEVQ